MMTMAQAESRLSRKIQTELRKHGYFCYKNHGSEFMAAGLPDIVVIRDGRYIGLETKMPGKRDDTSTSQDLMHKHMREAGAKIYVVCSVQEALYVVSRLPKNFP